MRGESIFRSQRVQLCKSPTKPTFPTLRSAVVTVLRQIECIRFVYNSDGGGLIPCLDLQKPPALMICAIAFYRLISRPELIWMKSGFATVMVFRARPCARFCSVYPAKAS